MTAQSSSRAVEVPPQVEAAFASHYRRIHPVVLRIARRRLDQDAAEDAVQSVFARLWERTIADSPAPLPDDPEHAMATVLRALRNELISLHRAKMPLERDAESIAAELEGMFRPWMETDVAVREDELSVIVNRIVDRLPTRCRETFVRVHVEHESYVDAARAMGVSERTVHAQLAKASRTIRQRLIELDVIGARTLTVERIVDRITTADDGVERTTSDGAHERCVIGPASFVVCFPTRCA